MLILYSYNQRWGGGDQGREGDRENRARKGRLLHYPERSSHRITAQTWTGEQTLEAFRPPVSGNQEYPRLFLQLLAPRTERRAVSFRQLA